MNEAGSTSGKLQACRHEALRLRADLLRAGAAAQGLAGARLDLDTLDRSMTSSKLLLSHVGDLAPHAGQPELQSAIDTLCTRGRAQISRWEESLDRAQLAPEWRQLEIAKQAQTDLVQMLTHILQLLDVWFAESERR